LYNRLEIYLPGQQFTKGQRARCGAKAKPSIVPLAFYLYMSAITQVILQSPRRPIPPMISGHVHPPCLIKLDYLRVFCYVPATAAATHQSWNCIVLSFPW